VTVIDDDEPGVLAVHERHVKIRAKDEVVVIKVMRHQGCDGIVKCQYETFIPDNSGENTAVPYEDFDPVKGTLVFENGETSKEIQVNIHQRQVSEHDNYRDDLFGFKIYQPEGGARINKKDICYINIVGDHELIDHMKHIQELLESVRDNDSMTWGQQFKNAIVLAPSVNEEGRIEEVGNFEALLHFFSIGWKVFFSLIPPKRYSKGKAAFFASLGMIGALTAVVGEFAGLFGCVLGIKNSVTAISFVALGTSLPDTFASKQAAQESKNADSAIGNITGSNSVNVFLGLGLPWIMASIYYESKGQKYEVPSEGLAFSVGMFLLTSVFCLLTLVLRRKVSLIVNCQFIGGELGGYSKTSKVMSASFLVSLWCFYILMSTLKAYDLLEFIGL